jgi:hypothetical protein
VAEVGVDRGPGQDLVAGADDFDSHSGARLAFAADRRQLGA